MYNIYSNLAVSYKTPHHNEKTVFRLYSTSLLMACNTCKEDKI